MRPAASLAAAVLVIAGCAPSPPARWTEPKTGMRFVRVSAGAFEMGSPPGEIGREEQESLHRVTISKPFYLGETEVTQAQWTVVMGSNPSAFAECGPNCPVERVSWSDVRRFLEKLGADGRSYRLPTEAEWESACRAGTATPFSSGTTLTRADANIDDSDPMALSAPIAPIAPIAGAPREVERGSTKPVASFPPNPWGLFDLHGNVWEWTSDEHCPYPGEARLPSIDPAPRCGAALKVIRGGSWHFGADSARCALRYTHDPNDSGFSLGFRVARSIG